MDDPLLVEVQSEDYWYEGYNMRTGARGIFPAYYAIEVTKDPELYRGEHTTMIKTGRAVETKTMPTYFSFFFCFYLFLLVSYLQ